ncbi:kinase-like domain-containing protein [Vararia minispora EC-137]|uniref:Kinase-like domain-containing protein n=1 Tax=Vararia minispora EC-137 TaxID=1314806 RepID=A0ACB8QR96_9AGAM|nr:kinase-like domain-containing protein [Vararia minispora EC-137]
MGCTHSSNVDLTRDVCLHHFDLHRVIGKGSFGKVRVVQHKRSKAAYALKYVNKQQCLKQKAVANVVRERQLLEEVRHPFLVNLRYAFQDEENCFFVLDLMLGGDLRYHLTTKGCFPERVVRFWIAEVSCGLAFLHRERIVHRDLKPDNILLDAAGHAHITDFNVATYYTPRRGHTSVTGTVAYMAPEMLHSARYGYQWQVDWWALGVIAHELLWMKRPFDGTNVEKITQRILNDPIVVPPCVNVNMRPISMEGCHALLDRNPRTRLGCGNVQTSLEEVRRHAWFASLDWCALQAKEHPPPFVPDPNEFNFDLGLEMDEYMLAERKPGSKRHTPIDMEKLSPEQRKLLVEFTPFDFERPARRTHFTQNSPATAYYPTHHIVAGAPLSQTTTFVGVSKDPSPASSATSSYSGSVRSSSDTRYIHS